MLRWPDLQRPASRARSPRDRQSARGRIQRSKRPVRLENTLSTRHRLGDLGGRPYVSIVVVFATKLIPVAFRPCDTALAAPAYPVPGTILWHGAVPQTPRVCQPPIANCSGQRAAARYGAQ